MKPMKDNRGFTLIELIVVMMIMAIFAVGSITAFNLSDSGSAKNAAKRILSKLDYVQMENMTKTKSYYLQIMWDTTKQKYVLNTVAVDASLNSVTESSEDLDLKNEQISYWCRKDGFDTRHTINKSNTDNSMDISFQKDTGGVVENTTLGYINKISITSAGATRNIVIVTATGKHFIE